MSRAHDTPGFLAGARPAPLRRRGEWWALATLALLLGGQLLWLKWDALAASPRLRPLLEAGCGLLHCPLPAWREPGAFSMLSRDVIAPPDRPGVLRVQASFRNDARWAQPWPALVLTLADANGRTLGSRRFLPREYLGPGPHPALLQPGQASQIAFDLVEPAPDVVAFDFRFE
ncbi:MAG: DUF3426 domain-containing protein [Stenotrophomonas sp.]|jgi:hypothetical protein|nr:DUF3426 domain-containing protein [Xanthomonadales bacterium]MBN8768616.1 DUF3426 domain-containing protein [Stenotrophomonas sp.]